MVKRIAGELEAISNVTAMKAAFADLQKGTYVVTESIGTRTFSHHGTIGQ